MSRTWRTNDGEWTQKPRDLGVSGLALFAGETGITPPSPADIRAHESGDQRKQRLLGNLESPATDNGRKRREWIDRIHAALVAQLAATGYEGVVSANEARAVFLGFADLSAEERAQDFRFLAALWKRAGWRFVDYLGVSEAPGTHGRKIARFRYEPSAADRAESAA